MKKICERCGQLRDTLSWEKLCFKCTKEKELERVQKEIAESEDDECVDTFSSDYVICPYCGEAWEPHARYPYFPEMYENGTHILECPECERTFGLETNVSYSWKTHKLKKV